MTKFALHDKALAYALAEEKKGVHEIPLGSNRGPRVEHYQTYDWIPGGGYPWCISFCQAAWAEGAGHKLPWASAGAYDILERAKRDGWTCPLSLAVPGDLVIFNVGTGHGAILRAPWKGGSNPVLTVDGNVSDRVALRERSASLVRGVVHIPEKATGPAPPPPPVAKPPMFEVVTGEGDAKKLLYVSGAKAISRVLPRLLRNNKGGLTIRPKKKK